MDLVTRTLLIGGAFLNLCALAYILGMAYIIPMAFGRARSDEMFLFLFSTLIILSSVVSWIFFQRDNRLLAMIFMYAWWIAAVWFVNRLAFGTIS